LPPVAAGATLSGSDDRKVACRREKGEGRDGSIPADQGPFPPGRSPPLTAGAFAHNYAPLFRDSEPVIRGSAFDIRGWGLCPPERP